MKEYKFRGKTLSDGNWIYGTLIRDNDNVYITNKQYKSIAVDTNNKRYINYKVIEVLPESVEQFTGFYDVDGNEIYESVKDSSYVKFYKSFRKELDEMCVPLVIEELVWKNFITADNKIVGMIGGYDDYIDCVYVLPEYRRKGIAKKAVLDYVKDKIQYGIQLHIINNNTVAYDFWNSLFDLDALDRNDVDTLYEIIDYK